MNKNELSELNSLKKEIDDLYNFIFVGNTLTIKFFGKEIVLRRPNTYSKEEYRVPTELKNEIMNVLTNYLIKKQDEFASK